MKIFLDIDGVVANFNGAAAKLYGKNEDDLRAAQSPGDYNGIYSALGTTEEEFWKKVDALGEEFWVTVERYPWADFLFDACSARCETVFLSAPSVDSSSFAGKVKWLQAWRGRGFRDFIFAPPRHKRHLAGPDSILIDDRDRNIEEWRSGGGIGILFPRPWNSDHALSDDCLAVALDRLAAVFNKRKEEGRKDDGLRYDLIPSYPLALVAEVFTIGARKYADNNWRKGIPWHKMYRALISHANRFWAGESRDPDGQHHLASVVFMAMALMEYEKTAKQLDDRFVGGAGVEEITKKYAKGG